MLMGPDPLSDSVVSVRVLLGIGFVDWTQTLLKTPVQVQQWTRDPSLGSSGCRDLSTWIQGDSALSNMGMFVVEMSSDSFHLLGRSSSQRDPDMALFFLSPLEWCSSRWVSFQEIVAAENFLYCFGMIMEFAALLKLRFKHPAAERPYKIPFGTAGSVLMCVPPTVLLLTVVALASGKVMALGLVLETSLRYIEKRR